MPEDLDELRDRYFDPVAQMGMDRYTVLGSIAALDCWQDAGLSIDPDYAGLGHVDHLRLGHRRGGDHRQGAGADDRFGARAAAWAAPFRSA